MKVLDATLKFLTWIFFGCLALGAFCFVYVGYKVTTAKPDPAKVAAQRAASLPSPSEPTKAPLTFNSEDTQFRVAMFNNVSVEDDAEVKVLIFKLQGWMEEGLFIEKGTWAFLQDLMPAALHCRKRISFKYLVTKYIQLRREGKGAWDTSQILKDMSQRGELEPIR
ncbi:MAG TPA: hypothetical protein VGB77_13430 [Abditibacteriaceae bacterium]|jgi:hypothetical protein